jgi:lysozyme family protein
MAKVQFTPALRLEYENLFNTCIIKPEKMKVVEGIITKLTANRRRYETLSNDLGIPWFVIAAIHNMEAGLSFDRHLHNGIHSQSRFMSLQEDQNPVNPPFSWEEAPS